jgi:hypothetical protein
MAGLGHGPKPATEILVWAQRPLSVVPQWSIIAESTQLIEALLWSIAPARFVAACFELSRSAPDADLSGGVRWIAAALRGITLLKPSALTDMFKSREQVSTFLSIASLWNGILAASCENQSTSTTETASNLITNLRTLNCLILGIMPESIIQAAIQTDGLWWNAEIAGVHSNVRQPGLSDIQKHSARGNVFWSFASAVLSALANIAEKCLPLHQVTTACSAMRSATASTVPGTGNGTLAVTDGLTPNTEIIVLARKPLSEPTVAANVLRHGTGALNIDGCRVESGGTHGSADSAGRGAGRASANHNAPAYGNGLGGIVAAPHALGRWPANVIHDGSEEVEAAFAVYGNRPNSFRTTRAHQGGEFEWKAGNKPGFNDSGTVSRYFYCAKASKSERVGSRHPTVKPLALMQYLVRLVTPPGGTVLDPFAGTGTTAEAAVHEGTRAVLIEREPEYQADIARRMHIVLAGPDEKRRATIKARGQTESAGPLFAEAAE